LDGSVLSLGLFPGEYLDAGGDERTHFRFEAAWDSSLHNSLLLNRVTPSGETVYMTISAYLEVKSRGTLEWRHTYWHLSTFCEEGLISNTGILKMGISKAF
jgi:hypothetical protein